MSEDCKHCIFNETEENCPGCWEGSHFKSKPPQKRIVTKADRIRAMSDEELADELLDYFAAFYSVEWSREELVKWLKQEADT